MRCRAEPPRTLLTRALYRESAVIVLGLFLRQARRLRGKLAEQLPLLPREMAEGVEPRLVSRLGYAHRAARARR